MKQECCEIRTWLPAVIVTSALVLGIGVAVAQLPSSGSDTKQNQPDGASTRGQTAGPNTSASSAGQGSSASVGDRVIKSPAEWRKQLTSMQYNVTREKGTERPFTGKHWNQKAAGVYTCVCCGQSLFDSKTKFRSGTGWPSYYQPIDPAHVNNVDDSAWGMSRTEVTCSRCDAHLGHVFTDGPQPTGLRYCINSASLNFQAAEKAMLKGSPATATGNVKPLPSKPATQGSSTKPKN